MIQMLAPMVGEIRDEAAITRRLLERVPADKLSWKPHQRSMSLGQLALHLAVIPGAFTRIVRLDEFDVAQANFQPPSPANKEEIFTTFEGSLKAAEELFEGLDEPTAAGNWSLCVNGKAAFTISRVMVLRKFLLNHWVHHRGQLSVYLRLLDVPVPAIYGVSADENPFALANHAAL